MEPQAEQGMVFADFSETEARWLNSKPHAVHRRS
jgi:hypothetical protein